MMILFPALKTISTCMQVQHSLYTLSRCLLSERGGQLQSVGEGGMGDACLLAHLGQHDGQPVPEHCGRDVHLYIYTLAYTQECKAKVHKTD